MKQLSKELKSVLTTGYNLSHRKNCDTAYYIQYGYSTFSNDYVCFIYDGDFLLCKIKYGDKKDKNNYIRYTNDKSTKNIIKKTYQKWG